MILGVYSDDELGVVNAGHSAPTVSGMESLKTRLLEQTAKEEEQVPFEGDLTDDERQVIDAPDGGVVEDVITEADEQPEQAPAEMGDPSQPTAEELAEQEQEKPKKGRKGQQKGFIDTSEEYK